MVALLMLQRHSFPPTVDLSSSKNVFTVYLSPYKAWGETPVFIKKDEEYWDVAGKFTFCQLDTTWIQTERERLQLLEALSSFASG